MMWQISTLVARPSKSVQQWGSSSHSLQRRGKPVALRKTNEKGIAARLACDARSGLPADGGTGAAPCSARLRQRYFKCFLSSWPACSSDERTAGTWLIAFSSPKSWIMPL